MTLKNLDNVIKFEVSKIFNTKKVLIVQGIESIVIIVISVLLHLSNKALADRGVMMGIPRLSGLTLPVIFSVIIPIKIFSLISESFTGEIHDQSIKNLLFLPVNRFTIFLGKNISILIYITFNLLTIFLLTTIIDVINGSVDKIFGTFFSYLFSALSLSVLVFFGSMISCLFKKVSSAMGVLVLAYVVLSLLSSFSTVVSSISFLNYLRIDKMIFSFNVPILKTLNSFLLLISSGVLFFLVGYTLFEKKEF